MTRVLIVEDEPDLRTLIEYNLRQAGYDTESVGSGLAAQRAIARSLPDLVILDLMLPDLPGTEICREMRRDERTRDVPVLMLTAKGEESHRVYGLEVGADDYLVKPASMRELVLRAGAILRRKQDNGSSRATSPAAQVQNSARQDNARQDNARQDNARQDNTLDVITAADLTLLVSEHRAVHRQRTIDLTELETKLLDILMRRSGRVQSRATLLQEVWDGEDVAPRTVDMRINRLRARLGEAGSRIESVRGLGYRFVGDSD